MNMKKEGVILSCIISVVLLFFAGSTNVFAEDLVNTKSGTGKSDVSKPYTWRQCDMPYSSEIYPVFNSTYCLSSCGAHSITWMLLKSGVWGSDKLPTDAWPFIKKSGWATEGSGGYISMASTSENGHEIKLVGQGSSSKEVIKDHYDKGHYVLINVPGHFIALDYFDKDGNMVVLDSGIGCKYIECVTNYWGGMGQYFAYEIGGAPKSNSAGAKNFWDGDSADESFADDGGSGDSGSGNPNYVGIEDSTPPDPIIEFRDENEQKTDDSNNKGLDTKKSFWDLIFSW